MRLNRVGWGMVAAVAGGIAYAVVSALESRLLGTVTQRGHIAAAAITAGGVLWLADHLGMLSTPYTPSDTFGLRDDATEAPPDVSRLTSGAFLDGTNPPPPTRPDSRESRH